MWLRVGGGWDGDVEENRENCAHPWKNSGYAPANRLCGSLLTTLPDIKIIDYVTHLEFRACSLMAQVLLPEKRNWIFPSWPGTLGHETALKEVLYLP